MAEMLGQQRLWGQECDAFSRSALVRSRVERLHRSGGRIVAYWLVK